MIIKNKIRTFFGLMLMAFFVASCSFNRSPESSKYDPNHPGFEYSPEMYHAIGYEPLSTVADEDNEYFKLNPVTKSKQNLIKPVNGTIARNKAEYYYPYEDNNEGYEKAGEELTNPLAVNDENLAKGKKLYMSFCSHCHGEQGKNDGYLMAEGLFPPPPWPSYQDDYIQNLPEGKIFHSIHYGRNLMGSHAAQIEPMDRWKIVMYVEDLKNLKN